MTPRNPPPTASGNTARSRSGEIARRYAIRAGITAAVAAGIWYGAIRPIEHSVAASRRELERQTAELVADAASEASLTDARRHVQGLRSRVLSLAAWTEKAGDRSNAYDAFRQLAGNADIRIIRIEPKGQFVLAPHRNTNQPVGEVFGHGVHVTGGFRATASFLDRLESELGSSRVLSFRLAPTRGTGAVEASIDMSHIALNTSGLRKLAAEAAVALPATEGLE